LATIGTCVIALLSSLPCCWLLLPLLPMVLLLLLPSCSQLAPLHLLLACLRHQMRQLPEVGGSQLL
jgi:hypothetical protein